MNINGLNEAAIANRASDIHITSGMKPMLRVHGDIVTMNMPEVSSEEVANLIKSIMTEEQLKFFEREKDMDFAVSTADKTRYRANTYYTNRGPGLALRSIPAEIKSLGDLQCPKIFQELTQLSQGLILVTGPTGSGKSTTLAAMINHINTYDDKHIITIEDPIEFIHPPVKCMINQREVGIHTKSFASALKSALREDPDVILVGELRDHETIGLALTAAETGHLVFATLHTSSAAKSIDRIIDVFAGEDKAMVRSMLSNSIKAIVSQRLLKKAVGNGRVAAYEILLATDGIKNLIRENKIPQIYSMMQIGSQYGMVTMESYIDDMVSAQIITKEEAEVILEKGLKVEVAPHTNKISSAPSVALSNNDDITFS